MELQSASRNPIAAEARGHRPIAIPAFWRWIGRSVFHILGLPGRWIERSRSRAEMGQLDDRMLRDIGLSRLDVARELRKPFWRE